MDLDHWTTYGPTNMFTLVLTPDSRASACPPTVSAPRVLCAGGGEEAAGARCPLVLSRDRSVQRGVPRPPVTSHQHCRVQVSSTEQ